MPNMDDIMTEEGGSEWTAMFADLATLLLVFFILLYSLSEVDINRFKDAIASIQNTLRGDMAVQLGLTEFVPPSPPQIVIKQTPTKPDEHKKAQEAPKKVEAVKTPIKKTDEQRVFEDLKKFIKDKQLDAEVGVKLAGKSIVIRVKDRGLFGAGSAKLTQEATRPFSLIYKLFSRYPSYNINIKGHTDNIPISTPIFPSNWELSAIRATSVLRFFMSKGVKPERLTATGYADVLPLVPNTSAENRSLNRRVEFVLEKSL